VTSAESESQPTPVGQALQLAPRAWSLGWLAAFLLPALLLLWWLFKATPAAEYLAVVYGPDMPLLLRLPAAAACLGVLLALLAQRRRGKAFPVKADEVRRALPLAALSALLLLAILFGTGFLRNVFAVAVGAGVVAVAAGLGLRLFSLPFLAVQRERFSGPLERAVLAAAAGLGALALAVFVLGSVGLLSPWFWWPALVLAGAWVWNPLRELVGGLRATGREFISTAHPVALAGVFFIALWCAVQLVLLWAPPFEYDVLEYHLGSVVQYLRDGRISFLHENIFAAMPQNGEMLYLLGMALCGGKWNGLPAAHAILFAAWLLSICGVYALVGRVANSPHVQQEERERPVAAENGASWQLAPQATVAAALAALLYALVPLGTQLASDFYVEHFQALFHLGALCAACAFWSERRAGIRDCFGWLVLAGLLAGLACGAKYSALLMTLLPLLILLPLLCAARGSIYEALRAGACVAAPAAAVLAPWLVRNLAAAGDPLYPLGLVLKRRLQGGGAVPDRLDHFETALRSGGRSLADCGRALAQLWPGFSHRQEEARLSSWLQDNECGPHLLLFVVPGFLGRLSGEVILVGGFVILDLGCWFLFTHRLNRFFFPALAPLAVLAGLGIARLWEAGRGAKAAGLRELAVAAVVAAALVFAPLPLAYVWLLGRPAYMAGLEEPREAAREQFNMLGNKTWFEAWDAVNALPEGTKVLCLGDAQTFYLDRAPEYCVVFNEPLLDEVLANADDAASAARLLAAHGVTHLYINYSELFRLDTSYALTRGTQEARWRFAYLGTEPGRRELLWKMLCEGHWADYGRAWPEGLYPAYLKLTPTGYRTLEALLNECTVVNKVWLNEAGQPSCELRRLAVGVKR